MAGCLHHNIKHFHFHVFCRAMRGVQKRKLLSASPFPSAPNACIRYPLTARDVSSEVIDILYLI